MVSTSTNLSLTAGRVINTWADILNRANLGMEVHERNAHNFPLDLAVTAPVIVG
jgi:photosystem II P680 reaction center D1 protein